MKTVHPHMRGDSNRELRSDSGFNMRGDSECGQSGVGSPPHAWGQPGGIPPILVHPHMRGDSILGIHERRCGFTPTCVGTAHPS